MREKWEYTWHIHILVWESHDVDLQQQLRCWLQRQLHCLPASPEHRQLSLLFIAVLITKELRCHKSYEKGPKGQNDKCQTEGKPHHLTIVEIVNKEYDVSDDVSNGQQDAEAGKVLPSGLPLQLYSFLHTIHHLAPSKLCVFHQNNEALNCLFVSLWLESSLCVDNNALEITCHSWKLDPLSSDLDLDPEMWEQQEGTNSQKIQLTVVTGRSNCQLVEKFDLKYWSVGLCLIAVVHRYETHSSAAHA